MNKTQSEARYDHRRPNSVDPQIHHNDSRALSPLNASIRETVATEKGTLIPPNIPYQTSADNSYFDLRKTSQTDKLTLLPPRQYRPSDQRIDYKN
jgi:hypothetical protein